MVTITISGAPGSGTTTVAKILEKKLGIKHIYSGDVFRNLAKKHNMSLVEFGTYCEHHREIDEELDTYQKNVLQSGKIILEGRIAGWIASKGNIPAFKVLLEADEKTRVERIVKRERGDFKEKKQEMLTRERSEAKRYKEYYNIDVKDISIYDIVIDTTNKAPEEIGDIINRTLQHK